MDNRNDQLLKDYQLDESDFDYIVLGTGLKESIISASLQKNKKILNLDVDCSYSSSLKTLNLRELIIFIQNNDKNKIKQSSFINMRQNSDKINFDDYENQLDLFRKFNLDLQPRFIYSNSLTQEIMCQANIDKYMDFSDIKQIFHYDFQKQIFLNTPCSKGDIFKHKDLTLNEKRTIFKLLQTFIQLIQKQKNIQSDPNSLNDFDKNIKLQNDDQKIFEEFKEKNCEEYFDYLQTSELIQNIFIYSIANYEYNHKINKLSTFQLLEKIFKFIKSMGIHSVYPYLYTNYGTGDISQGFSRISAINGGLFIMNEEIQISDIKIDKNIQLKTNLSNNLLNCSKLIAGQEYYNFIQNFFPQQDKQEIQYLYRSIYIYQTQEILECPQILNIPFQDDLNSIQMVLLNDLTKTVPQGYYALLVKSVMNHLQDENKIQNHINNLIQKQFPYEIFYNCHFIQTYQEIKQLNENIKIVDFDDFQMHMDNIFQNSQQLVQNLNNSNSKQLFNQQKNAEYEDDNNMDQLIQNINDYNLN